MTAVSPGDPSGRRLRISHVVIQPVLVWDDGNELTPGPPLQATQWTLAGAIANLTELPTGLSELQAKFAADGPTPDEG